MSLQDELREEEALLRAERSQLADVKRELADVQRELDRQREIASLVGRFSKVNLVVPKWLRETGSRKGAHKAIATLHLTDTHFDEVIKPEQIGGYNAYDRRIAEIRLRKLGDGTLRVARDFIGGIEYEGCVILATGDIFSGDIHDELRLTNEGTLFEGVVHWVPRMVAFIRLLADDFGRVNVACVVGNHGRMSHKPIYKNRPQSNIEWLFWRWVAAEFAAAKDERVTFQIADGLSDVVSVYGTVYEIEHGDEFKGGSGISGARAPLMLGQHRTAVQRMAMGQPINWQVVGHFHQYQPPSQGLIMGGSLKGFDEYGAGKHLRPERPMQGFWVTSPENGPTIAAPIFCDDRKAEGW